MKLCVIGNSHCGALHDGWLQVRNAYPWVEMTVFADRSSRAAQVKPKRGRFGFGKDRLVPNTERTALAFRTTSGGKEEIEIADYCRFLVYGLSPQAPVEQDDRKFSSAVRAAAWENRVTGRSAFRLASKIRALTDAPIDIIASPYRRPTLGASVAPIDDLVAEEVAFYRRRWAEVLQARFHAQPPETVLMGRATRPEFGKGSMLLRVREDQGLHEHNPDEDRHMNADYGRIVVTHYLASIAAENGAPVFS